MPEFGVIVARCLLAVTIVLLIRLVATSLCRQYPWFFVYLVLEATGIAVESLISPFSEPYRYVYLSFESAKAIATAFVVMEMSRLTLVDTPAIARYAERVALSIMGVAAIIAVVGLFLGGAGIVSGERPVQNVYATLRTVNTWLFLLVGVIVGFILWFPVRLRRNLLFYVLIFGFYFLCYTVVLFGYAQTRLYNTRAMSNVGLTGRLLCVLAWTLTLRPAGELARAAIGHRWNAAKALQLSRQLGAINASLERLGSRNQRRF